MFGWWIVRYICVRLCIKKVWFDILWVDIVVMLVFIEYKVRCFLLREIDWYC